MAATPANGNVPANGNTNMEDTGIVGCWLLVVGCWLVVVVRWY